MQDRRQHLGSCDYKVGQAWNLIGNAHFRRKEHANAIHAYEQALECTDGCEKPSDFDHIAAAYGNLGTVCWSTGDMERSVTCIRKAVELRMKSEISKGRDPRESLTVATSYHQLGLALTLHRDYKKALNALFDALEIQQRVLGRKSIDVARTLDAIGKVHLLQGDADESMDCHQEAYATKYELTGECGPLVITSLTNIAAAHLARNEDKEAILAYLAIWKAQSFELHKINDPGTSARLAMEAGETIQMLVDLYTKTGAYQNAKLAADEALGLYQEAGISKDHPKMEDLKQSVKILYSKALL
jgi:tetratricopeptide (TPR) repeat protein